MRNKKDVEKLVQMKDEKLTVNENKITLNQEDRLIIGCCTLS